LAELMGMSAEDMAETIFSNFRRILQDDRTTRAIR
jgi:hypothetical protein